VERVVLDCSGTVYSSSSIESEGERVREDENEREEERDIESYE
jgi:hypothetical protein